MCQAQRHDYASQFLSRRGKPGREKMVKAESEEGEGWRLICLLYRRGLRAGERKERQIKRSTANSRATRVRHPVQGKTVFFKGMGSRNNGEKILKLDSTYTVIL